MKAGSGTGQSPRKRLLCEGEMRQTVVLLKERHLDHVYFCVDRWLFLCILVIEQEAGGGQQGEDAKEGKE